MSKKYILQKDLPELKAGVVFEYNDYDGVYISEHNPDEEYTYFKPKYVENNPEWFLQEDEFGKWVPVSERNPTNVGSYIISTGSGNVTDDYFDSRWGHHSVIAWMPKPKQYQP